MKSLSPMYAGSLSRDVRRNLSRLALFLLPCFFLFAFAVSAHAQEATIVGTVTDPSGAAVPNVAITVLNTDTGVARNLVTNSDGQYNAVDIHIGHYVVKAAVSGFKTEEKKGIILQVGDRTRVDFQLVVGGSQETVTVEANAIAVQSDTGEVSNVVTGQQIEGLSINGRGIYQLAALAPGASSEIDITAPNTPVGGSAGVEFNGLRQNHNIYLLDGGEDDDRGGAGGMSIAPSIDAIAEFRQLTSNYAADYGLSSAGTMTMVLKSGTKQFHASAWEYNKTDSFDARNYFNPAPNSIAELRINQFGFNVGGPVTFGKVYNPEKNKTFFFYNMEWRRYINGATLTTVVPYTSWYTGNFTTNLPADTKINNTSNPDNGLPVPHSGLHTPCTNQLGVGTATPNTALINAFAAAGQTLSTPDAGGGCSVNNNETIAQNPQFQPYTGNQIPTALLSPNGQALLSAGGNYGGIFPAPTSGQNFQGGANAPTQLKEEIVRIDHNFNSKFSVFGHFIAEQVSQSFSTSLWNWSNTPVSGTSFGNPSYSAVVHTTYTISPTLLNEVAFNYNGNRIAILPTGLVTAPSNFTFSRIFSGPNSDSRIPNISLSGSTGTQFGNNSWPWTNKADDYQLRDDVSWTKGAHQMKIGGSWALYKKYQQLFGNTQGGFTFNGGYTGLDFADYLLGLSSSYTELGVQDYGKWNNVSWALYFQDNWRVNHRLTLNLGLRWDGVPHTYEANNRMGNFYPNLYNTANAATLDSNGNICGPNSPVSTGFCGATVANPVNTTSPGLGTSPNPILAGYQFYLNGIGVPGTTPGVPKGLVNTNWAAFGPRIGFAYDLTGSGKTILRGGFGAMYERIQGNDMYNAGPNIPFSTSVSFSGVSLDKAELYTVNGATAVAPITVSNITGLAVNQYKLPVAYQYSAGVQQQLAPRTVLAVMYVGNQSRQQNYYQDINLPPVADLPGLINNTIPGGINAVAKYPGFANINMSTDGANAHYNGLQVDLNSQIRRDLSLRVFYTLSRSIDPSNQTAGGGGGGDLESVSNPYAGWQYDVGPSGYDRTQNFSANFIYDLPFLRHSSNTLMRTVVGGWEFSGIVTLETGLPLNITQSGNQGSNGLPQGTNRPDVSGSIKTPHTVADWVDPSAFATPTPGDWGTLGFDAVRGAGRDNWNLSLFKNFVFNEARGSQLELRFETFNTFNHPQWNSYITGFTSTGFGSVNGAFPGRTIQLGGKISF